MAPATTGVCCFCYVLAKLAEHYDVPLYQWLGFSGHSLKHILAAGAPLLFWFALGRRGQKSRSQQK